jgi:hypothetical protein
MMAVIETYSQQLNVRHVRVCHIPNHVFLSFKLDNETIATIDGADIQSPLRMKNIKFASYIYNFLKKKSNIMDALTMKSVLRFLKNTSPNITLCDREDASLTSSIAANIKNTAIWLKTYILDDISWFKILDMTLDTGGFYSSMIYQLPKYVKYKDTFQINNIIEWIKLQNNTDNAPFYNYNFISTMLQVVQSANFLKAFQYINERHETEFCPNIRVYENTFLVYNSGKNSKIKSKTRFFIKQVLKYTTHYELNGVSSIGDKKDTDQIVNVYCDYDSASKHLQFKGSEWKNFKDIGFLQIFYPISQTSSDVTIKNLENANFIQTLKIPVYKMNSYDEQGNEITSFIPLKNLE